MDNKWIWIANVVFLMVGIVIGMAVMRGLERAGYMQPEQPKPAAAEVSDSAMTERQRDIRITNQNTEEEAKKLMQCISERDLAQYQKASVSQQFAAYQAAGAKQMQADLELVSAATVLLEPDPNAELMRQAARIVLKGMAPIVISQIPGMRPRWVIPVKVKPLVYSSDSRGMQLIYIDRSGNKQGPFAPEILPQ
jgi:hypothetical protein